LAAAALAVVARDPAFVGLPRTSNTSLATNGTPCSGLAEIPAARSSSAARAARRASSA
jgi:hypothetical protein